MNLLLQLSILVLSLYLTAKGVEITLRRGKNDAPDRASNLLPGILLIVAGVGTGFGGLFWMLRY